MAIKVAVVGEIRSGKDTVCEYIQKYFSYLNVQRLYFAEGIEEIIESYFPEQWYSAGKPRRFYQEIGQFMRSMNPDVWVNYTEQKYNRLQSIGIDSFIVTDLRQRNEYDWLKANGFVVVRVVCDPAIRFQRMKDSGDDFKAQDLIHPVERQIEAIPYDVVIDNSGTLEELYEQVDLLTEQLAEGVFTDGFGIS